MPSDKDTYCSAFRDVDIVDGDLVSLNEKDKHSPVQGANFPDVFSTPPSENQQQKQKHQENKKVLTAVATSSSLSEVSSIGANSCEDHVSMTMITTDSHPVVRIESLDMKGYDNASASDALDDHHHQQQQQQQAPSRGQEQGLASSILRKKVISGHSKRDDFRLIRSKVCLLVIDIQKYSSEPQISSSEATDTASSKAYLYNDALPKVIKNIQTLLKHFRTYRDSRSGTSDSSPSNGDTTSNNSNSSGCEVIFTYLQSCTNDRRDISLDYKLSGPHLANIPTIHTPTKDIFLSSLQPLPNNGRGDILIPKTSCSVFNSTNIHYILGNLQCEQLIICGQLTNQCVESAVRDAADLGYFVSIAEDACAALSMQDHERGVYGMKGFCRILKTNQIIQELEHDQETQQQLSLHTSVELLASKPTVLEEEQQKAEAEATTTAEEEIISPTTTTTTGESAHASSFQEASYTYALLRTLQSANIKFIRYLTVDVCNTIRCKAIPVDHLLSKSQAQGENNITLNYKIALVTVSCAGMVSYADFLVDGTGIDARNVLVLQPDIKTLQILPYAPKSALLLGTLHDPNLGGTLSPYCTRGLLQKVSITAKEKLRINLCVGAEIEFCLHHMDAKGDPVDSSVFASSTTLNQQEEYISDLYTQLQMQNIPIETLHSESAPGQLEIVIQYQNDPVRLVDMVILTQETIRAVARKHSLKALFLPKIHPMAAGNGLHLHLSFEDCVSRKNIFASTSSTTSSSTASTNLSEKGQSFLEGILQHLPALLGLTLPTVNSFRRVGVGCWTGYDVEWAIEDKESPLRVCSNLMSGNHQLEHVEYKLCDSTANLYMGLAGIFFCGLNGMQNKLSLRPPRGSVTSSAKETTLLPSSLEESLEFLEKDDLLCKELLGPNFSKSYIALRRNEAKRSSRMSLDDEVKEALHKA